MKNLYEAVEYGVSFEIDIIYSGGRIRIGIKWGAHLLVNLHDELTADVHCRAENEIDKTNLALCNHRRVTVAQGRIGQAKFPLLVSLLEEFLHQGTSPTVIEEEAN